MAETDIEVRIKMAIDAADAATTVGETRRALKDLKSLGIEVGDTNSEAFKKINKAVGETNDRIGDMNQAFKSLSGEPLENITNSFRSLKDSILKLDLKSAKIAFNNLGSSIADMGKLIMANPLLLLAGIVAGVVAAIYELRDAGGFAGDMFKEIAGTIKDVITDLKNLSDAFGLTAFAAKDSVEKQLKFLSSLEEVTKSTYDNEIELAQAKNQKTFDLEREKTKFLIKSANDRMAALDKIDPRDLTTEQTKEYHDLIMARKKFFSDLNVIDAKQQADKDKTDAENQKEVDKKIKEDTAEYKRKLKEKEDFFKRLNSVAVKSLEETLAKEQELKAKEQIDNDNRELDAQVKAAQITANRIGSINALVDAEIIARTRLLQNDKLTATEKENIIRESEDKIASIRADGAEKIKQVSEDVKQKEIKDLEELKQKRDEDNAQIIAGAQAVAGLMNAIGDLVATADQNREKKTLAEKNKAAKKAFNTQKALGIVNAGIGTAQAVMQALGSMPPPASFVFAALAGVTGAIQIATIAAKKFNPEQPSSTGGPTPMPAMPSASSASSAPMPSFKAPQFFGLGQKNLLDQSKTGDQRVYVVESDITNSQRRVKTTEQRSKLGG